MESEPQPPATGEPAEPIVARLVATGEARAELAAPQWLHPTSVIFSVLTTVKQFAIALVVAVFLAGSGNQFAAVGAGIAVVMTALTALFRYLTLRYQLTGGELRIDEGLIFQRHRAIPVNRIQNIDLLQNPFHHLFKVAEVRIETAGGSEPEATLRVLSLDDVQRLRTAIFGNHSSTPPAPEQAPQTPHAEGDLPELPNQAPHSARLLLTISFGQLIKAGMLSNRGLVLIPIMLGLFNQLNLDERVDFERLAGFFPDQWNTLQAFIWSTIGMLVGLAILRIVSAGWYLLRFYGYRLERHGEDLRVRCGLFTQVSATVPRRRIQFISVQQTLLGRWFGLAVIRLETAGGAGKQNEDAKESVARRWFVPVIGSSEIGALLKELRDGLQYTPAAESWRATDPSTGRRLSRLAVLQALLIAGVGLLISQPWGAAAGLPALLILVWYARRYARSLKYSANANGIVFRSGIFTKKTSFTFFDKIQAVSWSQSWFDRRWSMATLRIDTAAAGPARHRIAVQYLPAAVATREVERIALLASNEGADGSEATAGGLRHEDKSC